MKQTAFARGVLAAVCTATLAAPAASYAAPGGHGHGRTHTAPTSAARQAQLVKDAQKAAPAMVKALGLSADNTFQVKNVVTDADGATHVHVDRFYKKVPVVGADLVIHRNARGAVTGHDGMFDTNLDVALTASISDAVAQQKATAAATRHKGKAGLAKAKADKPSLAIYVGAGAAPKLTFETRVRGEESSRIPARVRTFVDAHSGAPVAAFDEVQHASGNGIYDRNVQLTTDTQNGQYVLGNPNTGNYTTDSGNRKVDGTLMSDSDNVWGNGSNSNRQSAGVDAQYGADKTFDYYKTLLGRNGIWNNGKGARSRVHYDTSMSNAFWDGTQMTYGDGDGDRTPFTELDVAGHEMSHGVTENTAGLQYTGDAGGLNEATSDIFGAGVEWYANLASDGGDYLMGDKLNINGDGTPLRYMDKPSKDGASADCWSPSIANLDPHFSSGPLNHWYYLASEGSGAKAVNGVNYNSPTCGGAAAVAGAGHANIEKVWYRALSTKLTSTSDYRAAREAGIKSAIELYGASSQVCTSVEGAFNAINVPKGSATCSTGGDQPTPPTGSNVLINGGFEQGATGWTGSTGAINTDAGRPAGSGSWKLWLGGNGATGTEAVQQTFTVPANGKLTYHVGIDTAEDNSANTKYDTAAVQIISGSTTTTVGAFSNLDASNNWITRTVDLSRWAGQKVTLKLTATEDSMAQTSFVFDDLAVQ